MNLVILLTTVAQKSQARQLAEASLEHRAAACIQILPGLESHYFWKGKREVSREFLVLAKTTPVRHKALVKLWTKIHPYDCPEIVALHGKAASAYARWISTATSS